MKKGNIFSLNIFTLAFLQVSFMPKIKSNPSDPRGWRLYPYQVNTVNATAGNGGVAMPVVDKGASGCNMSSTCAICEGDCDEDSDCAGDLVCFQRSDASDMVPGCAATGYINEYDVDASGVNSTSSQDYCYSKTSKGYHTQGMPNLNNKVNADEYVMTVLKDDAKREGWHIDEGDLEGTQTNTVTGETSVFGWRCAPKMAWYGANWHDLDGVVVPPFVHGSARSIGTYKGAMSRCPDGRVNAWEATVPNGVYMVTASFADTYSNNHELAGCTFENVRGLGGGPAQTDAFSVEVADGKFTLSGGIPSRCAAISWIKLDLVSSLLYPKPWLPSPPKEWWQMKLDDTDKPRIGLVQIILPHQAFRTADSYPHDFDKDSPDCRKWWMFAPAKCYRMVTKEFKRGVHPELAAYPDFPGFTQPFLEWLFDRHDTDGDGLLTMDEFNKAQSNETLHGPYALWPRPAGHNTKGTRGFHDDAVAHFWRKVDVLDGDRTNGITRGDGTVTRGEWVHGGLGMPQNRYCDLFEVTGFTHGANLHDGARAGCSRKKAGTVPTQWGYFNNDGAHGFDVTLSDTPCTDTDGCPGPGDAGANVTRCELRLDYQDNEPARINCKGATGKYLQISLPGDGNRLIPQIKVNVYRASHPAPSNSANYTASTNPKLPTVCYGVKRRALPAADSPDLLSDAKIHPKIVVKVVSFFNLFFILKVLFVIM